MPATGSYGLGLNDCNMITQVRNRQVGRGHCPSHARDKHRPITVRQCTLKPYDMVVALDDVPLSVLTRTSRDLYVQAPCVLYALTEGAGQLAPGRALLYPPRTAVPAPYVRTA